MLYFTSTTWCFGVVRKQEVSLTKRTKHQNLMSNIQSSVRQKSPINWFETSSTQNDEIEYVTNVQ